MLINDDQSWVRLRGPVIKANGRLTFEDDLRSGGLLCFISMNASVRIELQSFIRKEITSYRIGTLIYKVLQ